MTIEQGGSAGSASDVSSADIGGSPDKGGEGVNFEALFGQTQAELAETKEQASRVSKEFESFKSEAKKTQETLEKLKSVFTPQEAGAVDPVDSEIEALQAEIEEFQTAAIEADKRGRPIPMTAKIGINNAKRMIAALTKEKQLAAKIAELEGTVKKVADPGFASLQQMYDKTDNLIESSLQGIYGKDDQYALVRENQFGAVQKQIAAEFKNLAENFPQDWKRMQRDETALKKLVSWVVEKNIPPVARKIMKEDEIQRTPMSFEQVYSAFLEQREITKAKPTPQNKQLLKELRTKSFEAYGQKQFKGKKTGLSKLSLD